MEIFPIHRNLQVLLGEEAKFYSIKVFSVTALRLQSHVGSSSRNSVPGNQGELLVPPRGNNLEKKPSSIHNPGKEGLFVNVALS